MSKTVIYGNGSVASLARFFFRHDSEHEVVAFCVDDEFMDSSTLDDLPVIALDELLQRYPPDGFSAFIAMGFRKLNRDREQRYEQLKGMGYSFVSYVSSTAAVAPDAVMGANSFLMERCVVQPFVTIGDNVTMGPGTTIGHHGVIGNHCFFASRADVSGHVAIEDRCFVGANSTIRNAVTIGHDSVIGAGAVIMDDTDPKSVHAAQRSRLIPLPSDKLPRL